MRIKETLYEKFIEDSDPIKDMGIGINAKFFQREYAHTYNLKCSEIEKYLDIKQYIIDNEYSDSKETKDNAMIISLICVEMFKHLGEHLSVPNSFSAAYIHWKNIVGRAKIPVPSYAIYVCEKIFKNKYGVDWDAQKVYEKFTEDSDPIKDMGIGVSYQTLTQGAILKVKQLTFIGRESGAIVGARKGYTLKPGSFLLVTRVVPMLEERQSIQALVYSELYWAKKNKIGFANLSQGLIYNFANKVLIRINENQFNKRFEIIEKGK